MMMAIMSFNADGEYQGHTAVDDEYAARLAAVKQYNATAHSAWRMAPPEITHQGEGAGAVSQAAARRPKRK